MIVAVVSTVWMVWWLIRLILAYDSSRHSAGGLMVAFIVIGVFPIIFFGIILRLAS